MKKLLVLSKAGAGRGHTHIAYLNDETGTYFVSESQKHTHLLEYVPPVAEQVDPQTKQVAAPAQDAQWKIYPGEDGHIHEFEEYQIPAPKKERDESKVISEMVALYREAVELEKESFDRAEDAERIYIGKHWKDEEKRVLNDQNRAALTLNKSQKHVNELSGIQRQERQDIAYAPTEGGDQKLADLLTIVTKVTLNNCNYAFHEAEMFLDLCIGGRGNLNVRAYYDENLKPQITVERFAKESVRYGPHDELDGSDVEYVIKDEWMSRGKLEELFPEKADDITADYDYYASARTDEAVDTKPASSSERYRDGKTPAIVAGQTMVDVAKKNYRVVECQRKVYQSIPIVVNAKEDFFLNVFGWKEADIRAVKSLSEDFYVIRKPSTRIRITKMAGSVILSDENPARLPANEIYTIPVYATKRGNYFFGVIENAKDAQLFLNKLFSLAIDIVNKNASYGWGFDEETFSGPDEAEEFRKNCNSPGFTTKLNSVERPPYKFEAADFPAAVVNMMDIASGVLAELLNISAESAGANESYSKLMHRQKMRLTGNEFLFDHLTLSKKRLGRLLPTLYKRYFQPSDIWRIVAGQAQKEDVQIGGRPFTDFTPDDIQLIYQEGDVTKVDVEVVETAFSPTVRIATFMMLTELQKAGVQFPPDLLLETAEIPDSIRRKASQALADASAAQAEDAKRTERMEIAKTMVAKGAQLPPGVLQEMGLLPQNEQFQGAGNGAVPPQGGATSQLAE